MKKRKRRNYTQEFKDEAVKLITGQDILKSANKEYGAKKNGI